MASDGKTVTEVFCDQGEDAMWELAEKTLKDLTAAHDKAVLAATAAKGPFDTADKYYTDMKAAAATHKSNSAQYIADYNTADALVKDLGAKAVLGTDDVIAKTAALKLVTDNTDAAELAVDQQRGRVEKLYAAKSTQDGEVSAWSERVTAANTAKLAADAAKLTADQNFTEMVEQRSTRSWLFSTMGLFDTAQWASGCEATGQT